MYQAREFASSLKARNLSRLTPVRQLLAHSLLDQWTLVKAEQLLSRL
jgi:hypothetical protein